MAAKKRKVGRPRIEFSLQEVEKLGRIAATHREIASFFDCGERTVKERMAGDADFRTAYEKGYGNSTRGLRRKQMELAMAGDKTMLIWLGKQLLGQTDRASTELDARLSGKDGAPPLTVVVEKTGG